MSANEKLRMYADQLTDEQASVAVTMIEGYLHALEEAVDDAFCLKLLEEAGNDPEEDFEDFDAFAQRVKAGWS